MTPDDPHDAVVVGSGAGGAMAAWVLTKAGASVLMLEAGRDYNPEESPMLSMAKDAPLRGVGSRDKEFSIADLWLDDESRRFASELQRRRHVRRTSPIRLQ